ncbi:MAG: hypothetical protein ACPG4U_12640 [Pseudomonadales bacterium]
MTAVKQKKFEKSAEKFRQCVANEQYKGAIKHARDALKIVPNHMVVQSDLAFALLRDKQYQASYYQYQKIFHASDAQKAQASATWLDGLTEVCGWLGREAELQRYGCLSLRTADQNIASVAQATPVTRPHFNPREPARNVIAYSLFGDLPRYCETAVLNAQVAKQLYPHWCCRFYVAEDVPQHVVLRLQQHGAQIVQMVRAESEVNPLMWRFLALDDPEVDFYLLRDADSLLCQKEAAAVNQWLASGYWYHHMRDYFSHTELLLAGMWGGCRGQLPTIEPLMVDYCREQLKAGRFIDQLFLKSTLWPTVRQSILNHDEIFKFHNAHPYPPFEAQQMETDQFHIGSNFSFQAVGGPSSCESEQHWRLLDEQSAEVCRYTSAVNGGRWSQTLPWYYIQAIEEGVWRIELSE